MRQDPSWHNELVFPPTFSSHAADTGMRCRLSLSRMFLAGCAVACSAPRPFPSLPHLR